MVEEPRVGLVVAAKRAAHRWSRLACEQLVDGAADYAQADIDELISLKRKDRSLADLSVRMFAEMVRVAAERDADVLLELTIPLPAVGLSDFVADTSGYEALIGRSTYPKSLAGVRLPGFSIDRMRSHLPLATGTLVRRALGVLLVAPGVDVYVEHVAWLAETAPSDEDEASILLTRAPTRVDAIEAKVPIRS